MVPIVFVSVLVLRPVMVMLVVRLVGGGFQVCVMGTMRVVRVVVSMPGLNFGMPMVSVVLVNHDILERVIRLLYALFWER